MKQQKPSSIPSSFWSARGCPEWVTGVLQQLADNPETIASLHGKQTGQCCFCSRLLTDDRKGYSVDVGYGPICAQRYGLKWGESDEAKTKKAYKEFQRSSENPLKLTFDAWASIQMMGF